MTKNPIRDYSEEVLSAAAILMEAWANGTFDHEGGPSADGGKPGTDTVVGIWLGSILDAQRDIDPRLHAFRTFLNDELFYDPQADETYPPDMRVGDLPNLGNLRVADLREYVLDARIREQDAMDRQAALDAAEDSGEGCTS